MSRPEWRDAGKERLWRKLVRNWERSGLTVRDFCVERGLAEHNFHAWRRTLAARDQEKTLPPKALPPFLPVHVADASVVAQQGAVLEIVLADGVVVRVGTGVDEAMLRQVLAALKKEPSC